MLADYGTDQFSSRINDTGNDIIVKPLNSFSFKAVTPFQTKFKTPIKNIINFFINNLSYYLVLMLEVMTTNTYTLKFQKTILFFLLTKNYTKKTNVSLQ